MTGILATLGEFLFGASAYNTTAGWLGFIFGLIALIGYLRACYCEFGILKSISISYCSVRPHWLFQLFMVTSIFCILLMSQIWWYGIVAFLFGLMTCNPRVNEGNIYFIPHMVGAVSAIVLANLGLGIYYHLWWLIILLVATLAAIAIVLHFRTPEQDSMFNKDTTLYWIEVASIFSLIIGLFAGNLI